MHRQMAQHAPTHPIAIAVAFGLRFYIRSLVLQTALDVIGHKLIQDTLFARGAGAQETLGTKRELMDIAVRLEVPRAEPAEPVP